MKINKTKLYSYPNKNMKDNSSPNNKSNTIQEQISNPLINNINFDSLFIFDHNDNIRYFNSLQNKNRIKLSSEQLLFLKKIYHDTFHTKESLQKDQFYISIDESIFNLVKHYAQESKPQTELSSYLNNRILESENRAHLSCRKLANDFYQKTGKKVGKSTVNNILRKELGFRYLKTTLKNNNIKRESGILDCFCFIKIFEKCMELGYNPIFLDESKIELVNNHYKCWRKYHEEIYFGSSNREKCNLILAVGIDRIFYYSLNKDNTNSIIFLDFLKELVKIIKKDKDKRFLLIMDNLSCHKKEGVIKYLIDSKVNVAFNARYMSIFNAVELAFRAIKRQIYSNIYNSIDEIKQDIIKYLEGDEIKKTLIGNYCETIAQYISYIERNNSINLNNFSTKI